MIVYDGLLLKKRKKKDKDITDKRTMVEVYG